jgi:peptidylprolyl isomerase
MPQRLLILLVALIIGVSMPAAAQNQKPVLDPENTAYMDLPAGRVTIQLRPDLAPNTVKRFKELVRQGFYNGLTFHRVIPGFMAQTGDPLGNGTGGSGQHLKAEFTNAPFVRGTLGMARSSDPDSADSQFFICYDDASFLNNKYTVFGDVTSGMEAVDKVKMGTQANNGHVDDPTKIVKMQMAADAK